MQSSLTFTCQQHLFDHLLIIPPVRSIKGVYSFCLFCNSVCQFVWKLFFFVKDFSATTWVRILKFGTKLDSDELYCVTKKTATYCISVPLFVHFSFSPMEISVTDFSAPFGANILKFCVHLQVGKVYCVNGN